MGYFGTHPMAGDTPMDAASEIEDFLLNKEGLIRNGEVDIYDYLFEDECFNYRRLLNMYKYEILKELPGIINDEYEYAEFVIPFRFIDHGIRVKADSINDIIKLLGDGGASQRDYDSLKRGSLHDENGELTPNSYCKIVLKYKTELFDEAYDVENNKETLEKIYSELECPSLLEVIFNHTNSGKTGLVNTK